MRSPFIFFSFLCLAALAMGKTAMASGLALAAVLSIVLPIANAYVIYGINLLESKLAKLDDFIFRKSLRLFGGVNSVEGEYSISFPMKNFPNKRECDIINEKHEELTKVLQGAVVEVYGSKAKMEEHFKVDTFITMQGEKKLIQKVVPKSGFGKVFLTAVVNERLKKNLPMNIHR
jgi:hypothetical protein